MSAEKIEAFYAREHRFKEGINTLREAVLKTELEETLKWGAPTYTIDSKNVLGIMAFKNHFGIWFFNGVFLKDPQNVLETAQDKTKGMRHLRFRSVGEINLPLVTAYIEEAIANQKKGLSIVPKKAVKRKIPDLLRDSLEQDPPLKAQFDALTPFKRREFCEYIEDAKQTKTKVSRMEKIIPMIRKGIGLNDKYRN